MATPEQVIEVVYGFLVRVAEQPWRVYLFHSFVLSSHEQGGLIDATSTSHSGLRCFLLRRINTAFPHVATHTQCVIGNFVLRIHTL
jgi:hypothetical protein